jgi:LemA protein
VALAAWAISIYNRLVALRNRFRNAFAQIDVQLKRRYDLIPNLVEAVKGYLQHERQTLEAVTQRAAQAVSAAGRAAAAPGDPAAMAGSRRPRPRSAARSAGCSRWWRPTRISRRTRTWPRCRRSSAAPRTHRLRAPGLQRRGDGLQHARESFPDNVFAGTVGFLPAELLQATESAAERAAPKVSLR